jgi:hypothetical protein
MDIVVTIRLSDVLPPLVKFELRNSGIARSASIKFVFILYEGQTSTSFERTWAFTFPRTVRNEVNLILLGVAYTAAIFEGILRGLEIRVVEPELQLSLENDSGNFDEE